MRFVLLREAGGLGDVVRTLPVARGLKERYPDARVEYVVLAGYEGLVRLSPDVDVVHAVSERERRGRDERPDPARHAYLQRFVTGEHAARTRFIDLYCPAYRHEVETEGAVTLDRVELFCRAAGVRPSTPRIVVSERQATEGTECTENGKGRGTPQEDTKGVAPWPLPSVNSVSSVAKALVGLAPYATHAARSWLGKARLVELARALRSKDLATEDTEHTENGKHRVTTYQDVPGVPALPFPSVSSVPSVARRCSCRLVFFHSWKGPRPGRDEGSARDIGAMGALRLPWPRLAAAVAECDLVISADSGIFHLAGALGVPALGLFGPTSGEIMCRPYPTHTWITYDPGARCRSALAPGGDETPAARDETGGSSSPALIPGCRPPCYCRPSRGYSPDVCGKGGCALLWHRSPAGILRRLRLTASTTKTPRSPRTATAEGGGDGHDSRSQTSRRTWCPWCLGGEGC